MKKETVNTFQEGINMDLNPLVTPNNVLTDALNAAILTYNGDELSLQTDAGNTKIKVPGKDEYVKLSEEFYPLGLKEYGGVLYIVSSNGEDIEIGSYPAPEFSDDKLLYGNNTIFSGKNSLYRTYVINDNFFKSGRRIKFVTKKENEGLNLTNVSRDNDTRFYIVKLMHQLDNGVLDLTDDVWEQFLKHKTDTGDTAVHWLASDTFLYYCPTRFKGKVLLQVIFDEPEYFRFADRPDVSFLDPDDDAAYIDKYSHKITFNVERNNSSNISIDSYELLVTDFNGVEIKENPEDEKYVININEDNPKVFFIPFKDKNTWEAYSGINYSLTPIFKHNDSILSETDLPSEFTNKFTITGTRLLEERYNEIYFVLEDSRCVGNNMRDHNIAIMSNRDGNIGLDLELTEDEYVFIKSGTSIANQKVMGIFEIVNDRPKVIDVKDLEEGEDDKYRESINDAITSLNSIAPNLYNHVVSQLEDATNVRFYDTTCSEVDITIRFSSYLPMQSTSQVASPIQLSFFQPEISEEEISYSSTGSKTFGREFKISVNTYSDLVIKFNGGDLFTIGGRPLVVEKESLEEGAIFQIGLITHFNMNSRIIPTGQNVETHQEYSTYYYSWSIGSENSPLGEAIANSSTMLKFSFPSRTVPGHSNTSAAVGFDGRSGKHNLTVNVIPGIRSVDLDYFKFNWVIPYEITSGGSFTNEKYINISNPEGYREIGNETLGYLILLREGSFVVARSINTNPVI